MVGRRKAAGSNINVSTAIAWQLSCSEMSSLKYAKFSYLKQLCQPFLSDKHDNARNKHSLKNKSDIKKATLKINSSSIAGE